ncbi:hypothetical protein P43SY_007717 [Pythium insidiosum]|uniref:C2 domain-containing protein n=1 Tax=Pythium insidiosum TaxID=114742 RepID=A0AAD5M5X9_PYTIN|nr:hypothetical protein P43SY_007717 [Pythium insidiosum]
MASACKRDGACASYDAQKQRCLERLAQRYSGLSLCEEQQRLRSRLHLVLLQRETPRRSLASDIARWRELARERAVALGRRQRSAVAIQRWWRSRRQSCGAGRRPPRSPESELPSSSCFVALAPSATRSVESTPPSSPSQTHAIVVELLGARDLPPISAEPLSPADGSVSATLRLVRESDAEELGRLDAERVALHDTVAWENHVLRVYLSPASTSPHDVLGQTSVHVEIIGHRSDGAVVLGRLVVALDLLETPLAERYAMTRWFPLERRQRAGPARGEVRLGVRFLARHATTCAWIPYSVLTSSSSSASASTLPSSSPSPDIARATSTAVKPSDPASKKPPLSPRRRETTPSPLVSPGKRLSRRRPDRVGRPEAMSPPSSPSSYASSIENSDLEHVETPASSPRKQLVPSATGTLKSGIASPRKPPPRRRSVAVDDGAAGDTPGDSPDDKKKPFLKRKPYKVVFRKLDWSRVGAKTDSNWGRPAAAKLSPDSAVRREKSTTLTKATAGGDEMDTSRTKRLHALTSAVHSVCRATEQTKGLALMKYRAERKTYLWGATTAPSMARGQSYLRSEDALQSLWRDLQSDDDGSVYLKMLAELTTCQQ